jgi:methionyl aminopeptidase
MQNVVKGEIITLHDDNWLKRQKVAGQVVASVHKRMYELIKGQASNLYLCDLDAIAKNIIISANCIPTFYKYKGFPSTICASINKELVHGFGNRKIRLEQGDILKIDVGATFEGAIGDCAFTYIYGKPKNDNVKILLVSCQEALNESINSISLVKKLGTIGSTIYKKAQENNLGVITKYGGHGLDYNSLHTAPFVENKASENDGIMIQPGLAIAIEPMFVLGHNTNTRVMADKWTVMTADIGAHFEHSVTIDNNGDKHIVTDHSLNVKDFF